MVEEIGVGYANGKIILMGEHSVVYGEPSLAIPFPATQVKAEITKAKETVIDCAFYKGLVKDMPELLESLKKAIEVSLASLNQEDEHLAIVITSSIPAERGMGSSAAVAVATVRGIYDLFGSPLSQEKLLELVDLAEKIAHGNPSGLDALLTSSDVPYYFIKGQPFTPLELKMNAVLVVADTGKTGQTREAVASIGEKVKGKHKEIYQKKIKALGVLAEKSNSYLTQDSPKEFGKAMNAAQILLAELGVSSLELDKLAISALTNQALGAKLTGGGRGGCMIALARDLNDAKKIAEALKNAGAKSTWLYEMSE